MFLGRIPETVPVTRSSTTMTQPSWLLNVIQLELTKLPEATLTEVCDVLENDNRTEIYFRIFNQQYSSKSNVLSLNEFQKRVHIFIQRPIYSWFTSLYRS